jgi:hypothetical protein
MTYFDDPNREAVGVEPAWAEGSGGEPGAGPAASGQYANEPPGQDRPTPATAAAGAPAGGQYAEPAKPLDEMTKDELVAEAERRGVDVDASMTKAQIREALGA